MGGDLGLAEALPDGVVGVDGPAVDPGSGGVELGGLIR
jgi:hypothetical protein